MSSAASRTLLLLAPQAKANSVRQLEAICARAVAGSERVVAVAAALKPDQAAKEATDAESVLLVAERATWASAVVDKLLAAKPERVVMVCFFNVEEALAFEASSLPLVPVVVVDGTEEAVVLQFRSLFRRELARTASVDSELQRRWADRDGELRRREEFLGVCAHDLRSPIGVAQSCLSIVLESERQILSPTAVELLARARRQTGAALTLVQDLLDVTSLEQGYPGHFHLLAVDPLIDEIARDFEFQAIQRGLTFRYVNEAKGMRAIADPNRIRQLLGNLLSNALKYTPKGKNVALEVSLFTGRRKSDPPFPMIAFRVIDEGPGIAAEKRAKIFDRFSQVRGESKSEGRGLGLAVAKQIAHLHDGNVWVESEVGKGSKFTFLLPHIVAPGRKRGLARGKIVIADPIEETRDKRFDSFRESGLSIHFVKNGAEAVAAVYHFRPEAVVLSRGLARLDEDEVVNLLKTEPPVAGIPVLLALRPGEARPSEGLFDAVREDPEPTPKPATAAVGKVPTEKKGSAKRAKKKNTP